MEQPEKSKIVIPEVETIIKEGEEQSKEIKEFLDHSLSYLKLSMEILETHIWDLEHINSHNQSVEDFKEEFGHTSDLRVYSEEEIKKVTDDIQKMEIEIKKIHDKMTEYNLVQLEIKGYIDVFKLIREKFKKIATNINPSQSN